MHGQQHQYRQRVYSAYVSGRSAELAPTSLSGLEPRRPLLQRVVREYFPIDRDASILDLGCGHGALLYFARQHGYTNVRGVDTSPEQVRAAKRLGIDGVVEDDLLHALSGIGRDEIDCVIAFDVIEHFTKDELFAFADNVYRVLKPNGRWIIHAPNAESPFGNRVRYGDLTHEQAFTRASLTQLLSICGFSDIRSYEDYPEPTSTSRVVRFMLWSLFRLALRSYLAVETGGTSRNAIFSQNLLAVAFKKKSVTSGS